MNIKTTKAMMKQGIYSWDDFAGQLDREELAAWSVIHRMAKDSGPQEIKIFGQRWLVAVNIVWRLSP